ncbi:hypothetical protein TNCV_1098051 [Trichonephila clavipes]|nr:hypothetical protein TNCV_1098051 [Trichonephila clavipes]
MLHGFEHPRRVRRSPKTLRRCFDNRLRRCRDYAAAKILISIRLIQEANHVRGDQAELPSVETEDIPPRLHHVSRRFRCREEAPVFRGDAYSAADVAVGPSRLRQICRKTELFRFSSVVFQVLESRSFFVNAYRIRIFRSVYYRAAGDEPACQPSLSVVNGPIRTLSNHDDYFFAKRDFERHFDVIRHLPGILHVCPAFFAVATLKIAVRNLILNITTWKNQPLFLKPIFQSLFIIRIAVYADPIAYTIARTVQLTSERFCVIESREDVFRHIFAAFGENIRVTLNTVVS